jgi:hypothetical protein
MADHLPVARHQDLKHIAELGLEAHRLCSVKQQMLRGESRNGPNS